MLEIEPRKYNNYNNFNGNIIVNVLHYWNREYLLNFLASFKFYYSFYTKKGTINYSKLSKNILNFTGEDLKMASWIRSKYLGITMKNVKYNSIDQLVNVFNNEFCKSNPIGIGMDSYYLPWNKLYLDLHRIHFFLLTGYNPKMGLLYCIDGYLSKKVETLDILEIYNNAEKIIQIINTEECKYLSKNNVIQIIFKVLFAKTDTANRRSLKWFANDLALLKDNETCMKLIENVDKSNFIFNIGNIELARYNFASALKFIDDKYSMNIFYEVYNDIISIGKAWRNIKYILIQGGLLKKSNCFEEVSNVLYEIAGKEELILQELLGICVTFSD